ncbi:MAG: 3'-5' exonuclease domain-containing protein 2 [Muribaculaceae bacterium]|nr:3'-5' exonuclease domain-containing protein 2 [Muribaculaceae bacterium]
MPQVMFPGDIHVIDSIYHVKEAVRVLSNSPLVGFDTETRPSFRKGVVHKTALIQISTLDECFLFRSCKIGMPDVLAQYLASAEHKKVGLSLHDDFKIMRKLSNMEPAGFIDLQDVVGDYCITDISLQKIYAILFGGKIAKGQQLTNWEAPELSAAQQNYGAVDAWACLKIYNYLSQGLFNPNLSPYIVNEDDTQQEEKQD